MASREDKLETDYQNRLKKKLHDTFPGCYVFKNDERDQQGIPDLTILYRGRWAVLEVKRKKPTGPSDYQPNQEWFLEKFNTMWYASVIHPENEDEVFDALQQALSEV